MPPQKTASLRVVQIEPIGKCREGKAVVFAYKCRYSNMPDRDAVIELIFLN